jgi:hypothetical protein
VLSAVARADVSEKHLKQKNIAANKSQVSCKAVKPLRPAVHRIKWNKKSYASASRSAFCRASAQGEDKRELYMKVSRLSALLFGSSLLFSVSVLAGTTNKKSLHLSENVTIEGKQLAPGDYKVEWSGAGPDVTVNILKGKETVASVSAHVVPENAPNSQDGYLLKPAADGSQSLAQVFFTGERYELNIDQAPSTGTSQGANTSGTN